MESVYYYVKSICFVIVIISVWQTPEFATADAQLDVDQQIDDVRNAVRKAEVSKLSSTLVCCLVLIVC